eukprot:gene9862-2053_t
MAVVITTFSSRLLVDEVPIVQESVFHKVSSTEHPASSVTIENRHRYASCQGQPLPQPSWQSTSVTCVVQALYTGTCTICYQDYMIGDTTRKLACKHKFHAHCVDRWLKIDGKHNRCPLCMRTYSD